MCVCVCVCVYENIVYKKRQFYFFCSDLDVSFFLPDYTMLNGSKESGKSCSLS